MTASKRKPRAGASDAPAVIIAEHCGICEFAYTTDDVKDGYGECRRYPPKPVGLDDVGDIISIHPIVDLAVGCCGEFRSGRNH